MQDSLINGGSGPIVSKTSAYDLFILIIGILFIWGLTYFATVEVKNSDFTHSLLVSQAILEQHTVQLDAYKDQIDLAHHFDYNYRIEQINGHYYYLFPFAPSVFSLPVVWAARLMGLDMAVHDQEYTLLKLMAVITSGVVFGLIYALGRCYLGLWASFVIALVSVLGSALISTLGIGLWNMNFTVILISLSLLLLAHYDTGRAKTINPFWLGFLLFAAFWTRPTVSSFILCVLVYVFFRQRAIFFKLTLTTLTLFLLFVGWSWFTYGQLLPNYYLPSRLVATSTFWEAFYGNAFSPARGLFIFSPFFIVVLLGSLWLWRDVKKYDLFWLSLAWFGLFYLAVSRKNEDWWGGHQYGPRLLTDGLPALVLITIFLWQALSQRSLAVRAIALSSYVILGTLGIFINSYQGLYNPNTYLWNKSPNIDNYPEYLFDWKYPQFLATTESLRLRRLEHQQARISPYPLGNNLDFKSQQAVFWNWYEPETGWRWTQGPSSWLVFKLDQDVVDPTKQYILEILGGSVQGQEVKVSLNGTNIGKLNLERFTGDLPQTQKVAFPGALLKENELNQVQFDLPDQVGQANESDRTAGMAFVWLKIYPFTGETSGVTYFNSNAFETGFSHAEKNWRWTDNTTAVINYSLGSVTPGQPYVIEITAGALGVQTVEVWLNDKPVGTLTFEGVEPKTLSLPVEGNLLKTNDSNKIQFLIPNASIPAGDSRQLGLAFVSLNIRTLDHP